MNCVGLASDLSGGAGHTSEEAHNVIVMKFGGSSVASATAIEWIAGIVESHVPQQPVVVVSAMGKTTDRLMEALSMRPEAPRTPLGGVSKICDSIIFRRRKDS